MPPTSLLPQGTEWAMGATGLDFVFISATLYFEYFYPAAPNIRSRPRILTLKPCRHGLCTTLKQAGQGTDKYGSGHIGSKIMRDR